MIHDHIPRTPQEDLAQRHRAYMEASQPIIRQIADLLALHVSGRVVLVHQDPGTTITRLELTEPEYPPEVQRAIGMMQQQLGTLRRAYRLE